MGSRPLGVDVAAVERTAQTLYRAFALVANSGDNSVTILAFDNQGSDAIVATTTIRNVPSPYAVVPCASSLGPGWLVTSPSDNSITLVRAPDGAVARTIKVGPQPYSATCFTGGQGGARRAVVSNLGDNTLSVVDLNSFAVTATIPGVAGSRGLHGIGSIISNNTTTLWVAGTDADVVTLVDLDALSIMLRFPMRRPTAAGGGWIASGLDNSVTFFGYSTLQVVLTLTNIPNPQDFTGTGFYLRQFSPWGSTYLASTGAGNSVVRIGVVERQVVGVDVIRGIPGAAGLAAGSAELVPEFGTGASPFALVTSPDSNQLFIIRERPALPSSLSMSNAASFFSAHARTPPSGGVAPGSLTAAFTASSASTGVTQNFSAKSLPLPTSLGGASLRVGGTLAFQNSQWVYSSTGSSLAPLLFVGAGQINFQVPPDLSPADEVPAQLLRPDGSALLSAFRVVPSAPGIFTLGSTGAGQAAVVNQDGTMNFATNPAARGSFISVYATGAGATTPPLLPGEPAPASGNPLIFTQIQPTVTIGGKSARVLFSGMAPGFVGLWQINVEVPQDAPLGQVVPLQISAGGVTSNATSIAVQ